MIEQLTTAIVTILGALGSLLLILSRFSSSDLGKAVIASFTSKDKQQQSAAWTNAWTLLERKAEAIAAKYKQTMVNGIKEDMKDGVLSKEDLKKRLCEVKDLALTDFKDSATGGALLLAINTLGLPSEKIDQHLSDLLEQAVSRLATAKLPGGVKAEDFIKSLDGMSSGALSDMGLALTSKTLPPTGELQKGLADAVREASKQG